MHVSSYAHTCTAAAAATARSHQSCPTLCDPIDGSPPGSPIPGILQARTLEWVAIFFSSAWKRKVKVKSLSRVQPSATPWAAAHEVPPSMGFSRQENWSGVPSPSPHTCSFPNCHISDLLVLKLTQCSWTSDSRGNDRCYSKWTQVFVKYNVVWSHEFFSCICGLLSVFLSSFLWNKWVHWEQDRHLLDFSIRCNPVVSFFY